MCAWLDFLIIKYHGKTILAVYGIVNLLTKTCEQIQLNISTHVLIQQGLSGLFNDILCYLIEVTSITRLSYIRATSAGSAR